MAPVYDFRHVEIDKIGRGKRVTRPPGGNCSDIFGVDQTDRGSMSPVNGHSGTSTPVNGHVRRRSGDGDTQNRLFGPPENSFTPRRSSINRMKSNIFSAEDSVDSPAPRPPSAKKSIGQVRRNPITGEVTTDAPTMTNGHNGTPEPRVNGDTGASRQRTPPGGRCSGIF